MDKKEAVLRAEKLRKEINKYRYAYHVLDKELISIEALDSLKKELFDLERKFPDLVTSDSPTQRVGGVPLKAFQKIGHEKPMLSFDDAFSEDDMSDWFLRMENYLDRKAKPEFYCELKIDGLAIELIYKNGFFVSGSTRGNGLVGEDVTQNLKTVEAIPLRLEASAGASKIPDDLVVRGEVFLSKDEFRRINKEQAKKGEKAYANPRNVAAGSVRQLDPKIIADRKLDSFEYSIVTDVGQKTHEEEHEILKSWGFKTNPHNKLVQSLGEVFEFRDYWERYRDKIVYEIDGIVVIANDEKVFEEAGVRGKSPRGAIAYKFAPKEATTIVKNILVQVGRTGVLTPVAEMEPVQVGGITITHATLHNADEIERLGLKIGDTVIVSRAGDVIPKITKVLKEMRVGKEKNFKIPVFCPVDGSKVIRDGVAYRCSSKICAAKHRKQLYHFVSRGAFDIRGLGPQIIDKFLDEGLISDAADIFSLQKGDIEALERFGKKSAENIINGVNAKKKITLARFLYSLGVLHVGEETALLLAGNWPVKSIKELLRVYNGLSLEKLKTVRDVGPSVAQSIYNWFRESRNIRFLEKMEKVDVKIITGKLTAKNLKLKGLTFVLTGTLISISRYAAKEKIRELGGDISEIVSGKTNYVIAGDNPGSKFEKAKQLGVKILSEKEFLKLVE